MLEEFFPTDALLRIGFEHSLDQLFAHLRYWVDGSREINVLFVYHHLQFIDIFCVAGRSQY